MVPDNMNPAADSKCCRKRRTKKNDSGEITKHEATAELYSTDQTGDSPNPPKQMHKKLATAITCSSPISLSAGVTIASCLHHRSKGQTRCLGNPHPPQPHHFHQPQHIPNLQPRRR